MGFLDGKRSYGVSDIAKYFDPNTGKLVNLQHTPPGAITLNTAIWVLLALAAIYILFKLSSLTYSYLKSFLNKRKAIAEAIHELKTAHECDQIRLALRNHADAYGHTRNVSLSQWLHQWQTARKHPRQSVHDINLAISLLSSASYGSGQIADISEIRHLLMSNIRK